MATKRKTKQPDPTAAETLEAQVDAANETLPELDGDLEREAPGAGESAEAVEGDTLTSDASTSDEPRPEPDANEPVAEPEVVTVRLADSSPVGALVVGRTRIERKRPGRITRGDFERFQAEYHLIEVKE